MRNVCAGLMAIVVSVAVVAASEQGRNFSGTWVVDQERTSEAMRASMEGALTAAVVARREGGEARVGVAGAGGRGGGGGVMTAGAAPTARGTVAAGGGGAVARSGGGGGRGGVVAGGAPTPANPDTVIAIDPSAFSVEAGGVRTSYPVNGTEVAVQVRGTDGRARASWVGDTIVIETTVESPNGPVVSRTSWSMEGDALVRETARKTYYKRK